MGCVASRPGRSSSVVAPEHLYAEEYEGPLLYRVVRQEQGAVVHHSTSASGGVNGRFGAEVLRVTIDERCVLLRSLVSLESL